MVSKVRYRSLKEIDIARRRPFTILVSLLLAMLIIAAEPSLLLFGLFFLYALSGFLRYLPFGRRRVLLGEELELTPGGARSPWGGGSPAGGALLLLLLLIGGTPRGL